MEESYDCLVIGSGPGGYVAAIRSAQLGLKTAIIEKDRLGGRCLNYACIPAKAVLRSAELLSEIEEASLHGIEVSPPTVNFPETHAHQREVIEGLTRGVEGLLLKNQVEIIKGQAMLTGRDTVQVGDRKLKAEKGIILAAGSVPVAIPGIELGERILPTEKAWALEKLPRSIAVVGSGASGSELASAYARLGAEVTLIEAMDRVLPGEDKDISRVAERGFKAQGIEVRSGTEISQVEEEADGVTFKLDGEQRKVDLLMVAAGRQVDLMGLGIINAGLETENNGRIATDAKMVTNVEGIYAIGDMTDGPALAHKASEEGIIAAEAIAGQPVHPIDYRMIPRATFTSPQVGSFGLSEEEAKDEGYQVVIGKAPYGSVGAGAVLGDKSGLVKIIGDKQYGEILGATIIGSKATELIQQLVNYQALEGGYPDLARQIHGHPTLSEAILEAARLADGWIIHG